MKSATNLPPKLAIANGLEIGELRIEIGCPTKAKIRLTSLTRYSPVVCFLNGVEHRSLKKHVTIFGSTRFHILEKWKSVINEDVHFLVISYSRWNSRPKTVLKTISNSKINSGITFTLLPKCSSKLPA